MQVLLRKPTNCWLLLLVACLTGVLSARSAEAADSGLSAGELRAEPTDGAASELIAERWSGVTELEWDELIPADWRPDALLNEDFSELADDDPRAIEMLEKLKALWQEAPVVEALDGRRIRLPGFMVPVETADERVSEFLLVPYYGACIHVPPPPANQTVFVRAPADRPYPGGLFDTVWVTGTLRVKPVASDLADAGYSLDAVQIEPYEE